MYKVWVQIDEANYHNEIELVSGMTGNMEIQVGKRSVIDYFLEPILGNLNNSLKENKNSTCNYLVYVI